MTDSPAHAAGPHPHRLSTCPSCSRRSGWNRPRWLGGRLASRLGTAAFLFFLIKGLAWLIVPAAIALWASL